MNFDTEPTIEDIKKFADEKRKVLAASIATLKKTRQPRQPKIKTIEIEPEPKAPIEDDEEEIIEPIKKKKQAIKKQIVKPLSRSKSVIPIPTNNDDDDDFEDEDTEEEEEPEPVVLKKQVRKGNRNNHNHQAFNDIYDSINNIKDLINSQKEVIIEAVKSKVPIEEPKKNVRAKPKPKPKPKKVDKTLDLTIPDKEVEQIISGNKLQVKSSDTKLQAFLDAFKRN